MILSPQAASKGQRRLNPAIVPFPVQSQICRPKSPASVCVQPRWFRMLRDTLSRILCLHWTDRAQRSFLVAGRVRRRLLRRVLLRMTMVLQLDVASLGALALGFHAVLVRGDAGVDEEDEVDDSTSTTLASTQTNQTERGERELT